MSTIFSLYHYFSIAFIFKPLDTKLYEAFVKDHDRISAWIPHSTSKVKKILEIRISLPE